MNRSQLIKAIATSTGVTHRQADSFLCAFITTVEDQLKAGNEVAILGFGKWSVTDKAARKGRNPSTGETMDIAARRVPTFKAGSVLKNAI